MRSRWGSVALARLLAVPWLLPAAAEAQPTPLGSQFEVASGDTSIGYPDVAADADGGFFVVWEGSPGVGIAVFGRRFDADEAPQGPAFEIAPNFSRYPAVAARSDGGFAVVWQSPALDEDEIFARRYDATATPESDEFLVNTHTTEAQRNPSVAADGNGRFVVVWDSYNQVSNDDDDDIFGQRFDAAGDPLGGEFLVNAFTQEQQDEPSVAAWPDGDFVVAWESSDSYPTNHDGVFAQRYATDGSATGGEFLVDASGYQPQVATHDGGFVVAFQGYPWPIAARRFDEAGTALGDVVPVSGEAGSYPDVAADSAGRFLVVWEGDAPSGDGDGDGVLARLFSASGIPLGGAFVVNTYTTGGQGLPTVAVTGSGDFVIAWSGQGSSGWGVFARRFGVPPNQPVSVTSRKLVILDKTAAASQAKVVWVSKDETAGITKGTGTDPDGISAVFSVAYPLGGGGFTLPAGASDGIEGWVNSATTAKFVNDTAPMGSTGAKVSVIKPGKLLRIVGKSLGDTPIDLFTGGAALGPILIEYAVTNEGETYRHCSEFDLNDPGTSIDLKEIAAGTGRKLVAHNGTPAACP